MFRAVAKEDEYDFRLLYEVIRINEEQRHRFLGKVRAVLCTLRGKRLGVLLQIHCTIAASLVGGCTPPAVHSYAPASGTVPCGRTVPYKSVGA